MSQLLAHSLQAEAEGALKQCSAQAAQGNLAMAAFQSGWASAMDSARRSITEVRRPPDETADEETSSFLDPARRGQRRVKVVDRG